MPEASLIVTTAASGTEAWAFVEDMDHWAPFLTGYQSHRKLDERQSLWTVKGELGGITRVAEFEVRITEWRAPEYVAFELEGLDEPFTGSGSFRIAAAAVSPATPPPRQGWWERFRNVLARRLLGWIFRRGDEPVQPRSAQAARTQLHFVLALHAGGRSGPLLDLLLAPMLPTVAGELAHRIAGDLDRRIADART